MVRQKLKWILQVLTLLAVGMACETTIASVYLIAIQNKSVIGNVGISFLIILSVCGGVSVAQSFVIFALEYYKASYTIAFAKENRPQLYIDQFHKNIDLVKLVFFFNLAVTWSWLQIYFYGD